MKTLFLLMICGLMILAFTLQNHVLSRARGQQDAPDASSTIASSGDAPGDAGSSAAPGPGSPPSSGPEPGSRPGTFVYYQFVDGNGAVRFAERLEQVPEAWRTRAGRVEMSSPPPTSRAQARAGTQLRDPEPEPAREPGMFRAGRSSRRDAARQEAGASEPARPAGDEDVQLPSVEIYTMEGCGYCQAAMQYMDGIGQPYTNHDVEDDELARDEYLEKTGGRQGVPVIDVEGRIMQGWNQTRLDAMLAAARR